MRTVLALVLFGTLQASATTVKEPARYVNPPDRGDGPPFSHVVVAGDTVYVAGTLGLDPETGGPPADPAEEARLVMDGIRTKLQLVGLEMGDLVQTQVFCTDVSLYQTFNEVYASYFAGNYPARAFVGSGPLLFGCRFEVMGIARR